MTASERLRERRDDYEAFTPNQMDAIANVVEAAEPLVRFDETPGFSPQHDGLRAALTALEEALS